MLNDEGDTDENPITVQSMKTYAGANLVIDRNLTVVAVGGKERRRKKEKGSKK